MFKSFQEKAPRQALSKIKVMEEKRCVHFDKFKYQIKIVTEKGFVALLDPGQYSAVVTGQQARAVVEVRDNVASFAVEETVYVVDVNKGHILCAWLGLPEKLANFLRLYAGCSKARCKEQPKSEVKRTGGQVTGSVKSKAVLSASR